MAVVPFSQVGDVGTALRVTITSPQGTVIDVTNTTVRTITLRAPDGTSTDYSATVYDGPNGIIQYLVADADVLYMAGDWRIQGHVTFASGAWYTVTGLYSVLANL